MAETALTTTTPAGRYDTAGVAVTMADVDTVNGNKFTAEQDVLLLVHNTGASPQTMQVTSQPDRKTGRTGHISQAIAAGEIRIFRFGTDGWSDENGQILIPDSLSTDLELGVVVLSS